MLGLLLQTMELYFCSDEYRNGAWIILASLVTCVETSIKMQLATSIREDGILGEQVVLSSFVSSLLGLLSSNYLGCRQLSDRFLHWTT